MNTTTTSPTHSTTGTAGVPTSRNRGSTWRKSLGDKLGVFGKATLGRPLSSSKKFSKLSDDSDMSGPYFTGSPQASKAAKDDFGVSYTPSKTKMDVETGFADGTNKSHQQETLDDLALESPHIKYNKAEPDLSFDFKTFKEDAARAKKTNEEKINSLLREGEEKDRQIATLLQQNKAKDTKIDDMTKVSKMQNDTLGKRDAKVAALTQEGKEKDAELTKLRALAKGSKEKDSDNGILADFHNDIEDASKEDLREAKLETEIVVAQLADLAQENEFLKVDLCDAKKENENFLEIQTHVFEENESLQENLRSIKKENTSVIEKYIKVVEENNSLKKDLAIVKANSNEKVRKVEQDTDVMVDCLQEELKDAKDETTVLIEQCVDLVEENDSLKTELVEFHKENSVLRSEKDSLSDTQESVTTDPELTLAEEASKDSFAGESKDTPSEEIGSSWVLEFVEDGAIAASTTGVKKDSPVLATSGDTEVDGESEGHAKSDPYADGDNESNKGEGWFHCIFPMLS